MEDASIKRILVIRIDFLGDMVCTTPLLHALKQHWPLADVHVLANKYNSPVLANNISISEVHHYVYSKYFEKNDRPGFFNYLIDRVRLVCKLRKLKFDLVIIPCGGMNKKAIAFARQLNVPDRRWHNKDSEFDDRVKEHVDNRPLRHEALSGFLLMPELGRPDINQLRLHLFPCKERVSQWQATLGKTARARIGVFVSNNHAARQWPLSKWQALINKLSMCYEIIIFHSSSETTFPQWEESDDVRCITTPAVADLIAAMTHLDLVISADSAPVHLASALQIAVVALFESRPEKLKRWYPLGVNYILLHEGICVGDIAVKSVHAAAIELLNKRNKHKFC